MSFGHTEHAACKKKKKKKRLYTVTIAASKGSNFLVTHSYQPGVIGHAAQALQDHVLLMSSPSVLDALL